jgi:ABC-type branched-subunit amino acid transport system permease subunit
MPIRTTTSTSANALPNSFGKQSRGVLFADQWNNLDNAKAHYESTGPEIWEQTSGKIDGFICSVDTGGTLAGTGRALKEKSKDILVACADPHGFAMYELFKNGTAKSTPGDSITEGIGLARVTPIIETAKVDDAFLISDEEAVTVIYELLEHEGLCVGGSTGINVAGAIRLAKQLGPGKTIVTILADSGDRYQFFLLACLAPIALVYRMLERIVRSPFGRALRAVRDDEVVAATLGKNVLALRIKAFAVGGAVIGLAGALHAFYFTYIDPGQFAGFVTVYAFMSVIVGGKGSNRGLLVGGCAVMILLEGTRFLKDIIPVLSAQQVASLRLMLIGLGLIAMLIFRPGGFSSEYTLSAREPSGADPSF